MISGRVDATLGGYWNYEAIELRQAHKKPNVIPVSAGGVPSYDELVLVTTEKYFENHVTLLRGLVQALGRGYAAVRANPQQGINALLAANPSLDPTLQTAAVHATLPAFFPGEDKPWGWQFSDRWNAYGKWMYDHHLIKHLAARDFASTNQLLAGGAVERLPAAQVLPAPRALPAARRCPAPRRLPAAEPPPHGSGGSSGRPPRPAPFLGVSKKCRICDLLNNTEI